MESSIVIAIGDELLLGQTLDTNSAWIGKHMSDWGCPVVKRYTVSDTREGILSTLNLAIEEADIVLITGGLGPTRDDITKKVLAEFFSVDLVFSEPAWYWIEDYFHKRGRTASALHRMQCYLPSNVQLLENAMGTAPGMLFEWGTKKIISMPGVPYEMKYIMENGVYPIVKNHSSFQILHRTLRTFGLPESQIAERLVNIEDQLPKDCGIAYLPSLGEVKLRVTVRGKKEHALLEILDKICRDVEACIEDCMYGYDEDNLESVVGRILESRGAMVGFAESCTGGKIASRMVSQPGSSRYFFGGLVSYSNEMKTRLLGVDEKILKEYGAVSEPVALAMLEGLFERMSIQYGLSITGIAGPSGGSPEKPVGTAFIAVGKPGEVEVHAISFNKDRAMNMEYFSNTALNLLRKFLMKG
jgi:nicotinamide-nucleotide amidase